METRNPEEELRQLLLSSELDLLDQLAQRMGEISERVGDDDALEASVRRVIVDVLRDAGAEDHERLSTILAPLMLASLRAEIRGSREMMVEALYPLTGRLVSAAVRNAFRELLQTIDSKVTQTFSWAHMRVRLEALVTRRPTAELMLQRFPPFSIDELLVIHRPTGLLIARSGDEESVDRDLVGSMLNAVMSLTKDAFVEGEGGELSTLEFGDSQLFVKSSPTLIVVVVSSGVPPKLFDAGLEALFVAFLDQWGTKLSEFDGDLDPEDEIELGADLRRRTHDLLADTQRSGELGSLRRPLAVLTVIILLLLGWVGVASWNAWEGSRIEATARAVLDNQTGLAGYPIDLSYEPRGSTLRVSGLVPDEAAREALVQALAGAVPSELDLALNVLPDPPVLEPDPIEELQVFALRNAIYFSEGAEPRSPDVADRVLTDLAERMGVMPAHVRLRIIGYADPLGSQEVNERLTMSRARFAFDRLVELGVDPERMTLVGRPGERLATQEVGVGSDSRRTEFEVYFTER